jgi:hypothetical protein
MTHGKLNAGVFTGPQICKHMRDTFLENSMNLLKKKKSKAKLKKKVVDYFLGSRWRSDHKDIVEKFVGELKKPGLQYEFEAALLAFTLRLLSTKPRRC